MTILIYNWKDIKNPNVGGAEMITFEYARRLVRDGHTVTWFSRMFVGAVEEEMIDGVRVIRRGGLLTTYLCGWLYYRSLAKKPDLVIDMLNTIFWQTPLFVRVGKRVAYVNQLAREVLFFELPHVIAWIAATLETIQFYSYRSTPFVCYAESTKRDIVNAGIPEDHVRLFSLGVDHARYIPGVKSPTPLFLCVSRLVRMKRTDLVIRAMVHVVQQRPDVKLAVVGYGYERERLGRLRDELGLAKNVFFEDENILFIDQSAKDKKVEMMQKAWALVFPSVKEGWGMTVTECAACGTPAIVTDVTGLRDSVCRNETGLIVSANPSSEELAEAMMRIVNDQALREQLSAGAYQWASRFDWDASYRQFTDQVFA